MSKRVVATISVVDNAYILECEQGSRTQHIAMGWDYREGADSVDRLDTFLNVLLQLNYHISPKPEEARIRMSIQPRAQKKRAVREDDDDE